MGLRPLPREETPQDNWPEPGARPPRSYSQIHFTLQSTPPPRARPRRHRRASPNVAVKDRGRIAQIAPDRRNRPPAAAPVGASRCSSRCTCRPAKLCFACGGGERDRTDDLLLAKQALSQLSYGPSRSPSCSFDSGDRPVGLVGLDGFEPSTPALSRRCSNQLSYRPCSSL